VKKEADRIKRWRERQKAEGKTSFTVLLSQEARTILTEEKEKTGESNAAIVERAIKTLKKQTALKHFSKREATPARLLTREHQTPIVHVTSNGNEGKPRILVDDLANYSSMNIVPEQLVKGRSGIYNLNHKEGFISRLFRSSTGTVVRRKRLFK
jgi:hypothetical protein